MQTEYPNCSVQREEAPARLHIKHTVLVLLTFHRVLADFIDFKAIHRRDAVHCVAIVLLQDSRVTRESASQLVQENLAKQKEIQARRQHEKQQLEAKLQQRLREKNQQQQFHRQQVTENEQ
jgi:hypothetical protein